MSLFEALPGAFAGAFAEAFVAALRRALLWVGFEAGLEAFPGALPARAGFWLRGRAATDAAALGDRSWGFPVEAVRSASDRLPASLVTRRE